QYSESGVVSLRVGTNQPFTRDKEEILEASNQITGILVESIVPASYTWYWSPNSSGTGRKTLPAFYTQANSSYMSVHRDTFQTAFTNGRLICVVKTNELGCQREVSVPLTVKARPTSGMTSSAMTLTSCGGVVKDDRDGQFYTTVRVGNQCWMAENMRYRGENNKVGGYAYRFSGADPNGTVYGVEYYTRIEVINAVCPTGWVVPSYTDVDNLRIYADNGEAGKGGYRLRSGNFWATGRNNASYYNNYIYAKHWNYGTNPTGYEMGFNELKFGLMGGGWDGNNPISNHTYSEAWLVAKYPTTTWQYVWRLHYSNASLYYHTYSSYFSPIRCILQSTSVN
ncbi:MAG: hypothetical protein K2M86_03540, partial [Odoribacter sp.]|nr:hypothetical protein [Odoribacter sp.]